MNSSEYQSLSLRTVPKPLAFWDMRFDGDVEQARTLLMTNCALGMSGESAEIAEVTISDEIGDGYWYAYTMLWIFNVEGYEPKRGSKEDAKTNALMSAARVCELTKKHAFHGKALEVIADPIVRSTKRFIDAISALDDQSASETFQQNIRKLKKRYPEGFIELG